MEKRINILAGKFLSGKITSAEKSELAELIESNEPASDLFYEYCQIWTGGERNFNIPDPNLSLQKILKGKHQTNDKRRAKLVGLNFTNLLKIAAIIIPLIIVGTYWLNLKSDDPLLTRIEISTADEPRNVDLPDGSMIYLNEHSKLSYDRNFEDREVSFQGEGFFEITKDSSHPFQIDVEDIRINVLGTSFNVRARDSENSVEIAVAEGLVEVKKSTKNQVIRLSVDETGKYDRKTQGLSKVRHDANAASWKTGNLTFHHQPLEQVALALSRYFNKEMVFDNQAIKNCSFKADFSQDSKVQILETISFATGLEFAENDTSIIIYGKGCE